MLITFVRSLIRFLLIVCFRVRVKGDFSPFSASRLLIVSNHQSFLDGILLGLFLPVKPVFVIHTDVAKNFWVRQALRLVEHLLIAPSNPMAIKQVIRLVESGRPVVIFPEGRITITGSLMKVYDGTAFIAAKTGATVVPVGIQGASHSYFSRMKGRYPRRLFPRITLYVQPATRIEQQNDTKAGEEMRQVMQRMIFASRPELTLFEALLDAASIHGRRRPVVEDMKQVEYTYGDLLKMSLMLGRICGQAVNPGDRVGILLPNLASTLGLVFGLNAFGRVPAMLNYTAGVEGMQAACTAAQIRVVITSRAFLEQSDLTEKAGMLQGLELLYLEDIRDRITLGDKCWLMLWALRFPRQVMTRLSPEDPAVVLFTSGSEGVPKGVVLSHRAILANVEQIRSIAHFSPEDKMLNALPLFHSFGLTAGAILPVLAGADVFLYPSPLHYRVIPELAYDRGCTMLLGTSTFLGNYARFAHPYDFFRLRYVIAGAEKVSDAVRQTWFDKFGLRIFEGYGATETAPVLAVNTPMAYRPGTVGQFLPGVEAKLLPVAGIEKGGVLHVRGPNLMSGYLRVENPGVLEAAVSEVGAGWYETGDVVELDEDGFVRIVGRVKRFAKVAGEMVSLESVEKLALKASSEGVHAASTQSSETRGETIILFTTDAELSRDKLQAAAREGGWPEIAVPRKIVTVDALPLLGSGKIDYFALKKKAETV